ncbi:MAG: hypothetical protein EB084_07395, partial [Proteobacteria bacterium]|nr:hypothetical protein [Pseudomonadota bacterium]
ALGAQATAIGAQAASLQAAAQAAAAAGHLQEAAALAAQAKAAGAQAMSMGATAKGMGANAMALGEKAQAAANIAKPAMIASGAIAIVDGGIDIVKGHNTAETATELNRLARAEMQRTIDAGKDTEGVWDDYVNVHYQLHDMKHDAHFREGVGGAKAVSGGLMVAAPFTGPAAPIVGGVGAVGYLGASIVGHVHHPTHTQPLITHPAQAQSLTQFANGGGSGK